MFPYTEKYTESESDIQNNDLLYKIDQKLQNAFETLEKMENVDKIKNTYFSKNSISKWSAFYGEFYGPPLAGLKF